MKRILLRFLLPILALLPAAAAAAGGTTVYVHRTVIAGPGDVRLGDLVQVAGDVPPEAAEALARSVAVVADRLVYVPSGWYRQQLEEVLGPGVIFVGGRSTVIPRGSALEGRGYLVNRLVDWLQSQRLLADARAEISVSFVNAQGAPPQDGTPVFQLARQAAGGSTDVTASLTGTGGGTISARFSLAAPPAAVAGTDTGPGAVKPGTSVNVVFHKGIITIEMPGRTTSSASVGDTVSVSLSESQKSFSGTLRDGKEVDVDLP